MKTADLTAISPISTTDKQKLREKRSFLLYYGNTAQLPADAFIIYSLDIFPS